MAELNGGYENGAREDDNGNTSTLLTFLATRSMYHWTLRTFLRKGTHIPVSIMTYKFANNETV